MSASREKKFRQDSVPGSTDPKTFKELEQQKAEKRSNLLYSIIGVLFLVQHHFPHCHRRHHRR